MTLLHKNNINKIDNYSIIIIILYMCNGTFIPLFNHAVSLI